MKELITRRSEVILSLVEPSYLCIFLIWDYIFCSFEARIDYIFSMNDAS